VELTHLVKNSDVGSKIESLLRNKLGFSRTMIRRLKQHSGVEVNGHKVYLNQRVQLGDVISINIESNEETDIIPQPIEIEIVYEDKYLLVVNKPPHMLVHPLKHEWTNTLANAVIYHYRQHNLQLGFKPVSRLDRNTSGLVVIAKNSHIGYQLAQQLHTNEFVREYIAIVHGWIKQPRGVISLPISRCPDSKIKQMVDIDGRHAVTHYQVARYIKDNTIIRLRLETGRTHQIRVHLSFIGFPLLGDNLYGGQREIINRQALHCYNIMLTHPANGEKLALTAPMPKDMQRLTITE
jgi:23S rRNA pseudouridine1911/1915/1917 synthase